MSRTIHDLSVWNKPLIDTCQYCSTSRANQALRSLANAGFQNRGVCLQAFPSFPSVSPLFHFLSVVSFLARPKPVFPSSLPYPPPPPALVLTTFFAQPLTLVSRSLLLNRTETLSTQATSRLASVTFNMESKGFIKETDNNFDFTTEILFRFLGFGDFKVSILIEN